MSSYYFVFPIASTWQVVKKEQKYRQEAETLREEVESLKAGGSSRRKPYDFLIFWLFVGMPSCFPSGIGKLVGREEGTSTDAGRKAAKGVDKHC